MTLNKQVIPSNIRYSSFATTPAQKEWVDCWALEGCRARSEEFAEEIPLHKSIESEAMPRHQKQEIQGRPNGKGGKILNEEVGKKTGLKLQPAFVEWMMGYPKNYTNLKLPTEWQG